MRPKLSSLLRSGLIALGIAAGVSVPAFAVPIAGGLNPTAVPAAKSSGIILVQREFRGDRRYSRRGSDRRYSRRHWDDGYRWRHRRHWDGDRHWRRNWRRYNRGPSVYLDFSIPAYRYAPRYYAPRYAPRRVYRSGRLSRAHVEWCYNRYRSYRAYDNSFQPYNGPRRQCWSPYS